MPLASPHNVPYRTVRYRTVHHQLETFPTTLRHLTLQLIDLEATCELRTSSTHRSHSAKYKASSSSSAAKHQVTSPTAPRHLLRNSCIPRAHDPDDVVTSEELVGLKVHGSDVAMNGQEGTAVADSTRASTDLQHDRVNLRILTPSSGVPETIYLQSIPVGTPISAVKTRISAIAPGHPPPEHQRLIYQGHVVREDTTLLELFGPANVWLL